MVCDDETDFFPATLGCCGTCEIVLRNNAPPHSNREEKHHQRQEVIQDVRNALLGLSLNDTNVNVLLFDDVLDGTLLTEDLIQQFPSEFATQRLRVFSPNVRADVVARLQATTQTAGLPYGAVVSGVGCFHAFLQHWEPSIVRAVQRPRNLPLVVNGVCTPCGRPERTMSEIVFWVWPKMMECHWNLSTFEPLPRGPTNPNLIRMLHTNLPFWPHPK